MDSVETFEEENMLLDLGRECLDGEFDERMCVGRGFLISLSKNEKKTLKNKIWPFPLFQEGRMTTLQP